MTVVDPRPRLQALLEAAGHITSLLQRNGHDRSLLVSTRLRASVIRPLSRALASLGDEAAVGDSITSGADTIQSTADAMLPDELSDQLWELAQAATAARVQLPNVSGLTEATAALQDLAITLAGEPTAGDRLSVLAGLQTSLEPSIEVASRGPYLVTNASRLVDWLGQQLPLQPQMALCRCGQSQIKPMCDGTHAAIGFTDEKDSKRVPDRRDTYVGQQVTVLDNRGICQHSGFCTDRLATVFHVGQESFVTPSGGRMDEIIRAVRDCPSGALSYAIDGEEARDDVDYHGKREQSIEVSKDGPYRITGGVRLVNHAGGDVVRNQGASLEHYALCRCGYSQNKPFCSGMHWYVEFHDPVREGDREPTIFEWAGGLPALTRMTRMFYEKYVPEDPLLAPLFATMSADHPQRVAKWLSEVFGGPKRYSSEYGGYPRMLSQHVGKGLTEDQRARWVTLLLQSARDAGLPNDAEFRSAFGAYIEWGSHLALENSQTNARPPEHMPMPHWDWVTAAGPPGSRVSAIEPAPTEEAEPSMTLPGPDETVSFESHIKGLFRTRDRNAMRFAFDLWSVEDVRQHAEAILERLRAGTMPCDGAWPTEQVDVFERWVTNGKK